MTLADLVVTSSRGATHVVLVEVRRWAQRVLEHGIAPHRDPVSTAVAPSLRPGDGGVLHLEGRRLFTREAPGDTVVTFTLLLQVGPTVRALWIEDHYEVPLSWYDGSGTLDGPALHLDLTDEEGQTVRVEGLVSLDPLG